MKKYLYILTAILVGLSSCKREKHFVVVASKSAGVSAELEVDDQTFSFSAGEYKKDLTIDKYGVVSISLSASNSLPLNLDLRDDDNQLLGQVQGTGYIWMILDNTGISSQSSSSSSGSSTSGSTPGSGCSTVQCSGITQAGNRCQRMTTNCSGRCYQHQ